MQLSIIIVNYNTKDLLLDCICSIHQNPPAGDYEILVADNNSVDGSEVCADMDKVTFLPMGENLGFSKANNKALARAKGEYILFLNPDTLILKGTLDMCIDALAENPEYGCAGCRVLMENGKLDLACRRGFPTLKNSLFKFTGLDKLFKTRFFAGYNLLYMPEDGVYPIDCIVGAFMLFPKTVLDKIGGFDERFFMYGEDVDLSYRVHLAGFKTLYNGTCSIIHKKRASSKKSKVAKQAFYESMWLYYEKHHAQNHSAFPNRLVKCAIGLLKIIKR
ncbi:MAG: glycosyltransferase family 2 protein [Clostridia bacterium]|nr:glycosyltransferase family 2 protein [Clostridia bacterium]